MNVNRVYYVSIYVNIYYDLSDDLMWDRKGMYVKKTYVYHTGHNNYIDLKSGEKYKLSIKDTFPGQMYIYLKDGLIPMNEILDVSFKRTNMPKRKILKSISDAILLNNKKEDDK